MIARLQQGLLTFREPKPLHFIGMDMADGEGALSPDPVGPSRRASIAESRLGREDGDVVEDSRMNSRYGVDGRRWLWCRRGR